MKKLLFILSLCTLLFSCKETKDRINEIPDSFNGSDKVVDLDTLVSRQNFLKTDTLIFEKLSKANIIDKVVAVSIKTEFNKDSVETVRCRLDFYIKGKIIHSTPVSVYASSEDPMWSLYEDVFENEKTQQKDSRFFELSFGVPSCGFTQSNFLFFIENGKLQLVKEYDSMGDGPYSDGLLFEPKFAGDRVISFTSKRVTVEGDESKPYNEDNEDFVLTYWDSTAYQFDSGEWKATLKSKKGTSYRKEFRTYNELYKQL